MVTLIVGEVVRLSVLSLPSITGGSYGLYGIPRPPGLGARSHLGYFLLFTSLLIVSYLIVSKLVNSRIGLTFKAIRESDSLAESVGINVARYKVLGFLVCSGLGALAGSMVIVFTTSIFPSTWNMFRSVYFLLYCFLGGMSHPMGAVVGAFVLTGLFEILRPLQMYQSLIYAALIVGVVLFFPEGILGFNLGSLRMTRWQRGWTRLSSKVRGAVSTTERKARNSSRDIWR